MNSAMTPKMMANTPRSATAHQLRASRALISSLSDHPPGLKVVPAFGVEDAEARAPWLSEAVRLLTGILVSLTSISCTPVHFFRIGTGSEAPAAALVGFLEFGID